MNLWTGLWFKILKSVEEIAPVTNVKFTFKGSGTKNEIKPMNKNESHSPAIDFWS